MKKAFSKGTIPWTKAREAVKAATPETDKTWVEKCLTMTNRQIEKEVKQILPPVKKKTVVLVLEGDMLDVCPPSRCGRLVIASAEHPPKSYGVVAGRRRVGASPGSV